jgi:hypothetical protein
MTLRPLVDVVACLRSLAAGRIEGTGPTGSGHRP